MVPDQQLSRGESPCQPHHVMDVRCCHPVHRLVFFAGAEGQSHPNQSRGVRSIASLVSVTEGRARGSYWAVHSLPVWGEMEPDVLVDSPLHLHFLDGNHFGP